MACPHSLGKYLFKAKNKHITGMFIKLLLNLHDYLLNVNTITVKEQNRDLERKFFEVLEFSTRKQPNEKMKG